MIDKPSDSTGEVKNTMRPPLSGFAKTWRILLLALLGWIVAAFAYLPVFGLVVRGEINWLLWILSIVAVLLWWAMWRKLFRR